MDKKDMVVWLVFLVLLIVSLGVTMRTCDTQYGMVVGQIMGHDEYLGEPRAVRICSDATCSRAVLFWLSEGVDPPIDRQCTFWYERNWGKFERAFITSYECTEENR